MTLALIFAVPVTVNELPVMLQLVPEVPVWPLELIVKFCALVSTNERTAIDRKSALRNEVLIINRNFELQRYARHIVKKLNQSHTYLIHV